MNEKLPSIKFEFDGSEVSAEAKYFLEAYFNIITGARDGIVEILVEEKGDKSNVVISSEDRLALQKMAEGVGKGGFVTALENNPELGIEVVRLMIQDADIIE